MSGDVARLTEEGALRDAVDGLAHLQEAIAEPDAIARHLLLRQAAADLRSAAASARTLVKLSEPPKPPKPPRVRGKYVVVTSSEIGAEIGEAILRARERAGLDEREAARSCGLRSVADYRELEAGTKRCRIHTAERIAAAPWIGPELGEQLVDVVQSSIDERQREVDEQAASPPATPSE